MYTLFNSRGLQATSFEEHYFCFAFFPAKCYSQWTLLHKNRVSFDYIILLISRGIALYL